jgi:cell division protein FtsI (penicillin-binding protein 3)
MLTIDADLQFKIAEIVQEIVEKFEAKEAALIVMNPNNGNIESMISYPSFDPNHVENLDIEHTKNRPATQAFETGSVIKIFSALAALEEEVTTLDEIIDCENTKETKLDGIRVRTVIPADKISFLEVIQKSNNIGTVKVTKRLESLLYDYYTLLGFGKVTGLQFPGEHKGYVNHPANWSAYSIHSLSYGYEITTTLLQLARAMSLIVNGGHLVTPRLLIDQTLPVQKTKQLISDKTLQDIQTILQASVEEGTGRRAKISGYKVIGKTGTAHIVENGQYNESKNMYTFVGAVEKETYKRVIVAYIRESKHKTYSSVIAAPLFRKAAETTLLHDHVIV